MKKPSQLIIDFLKEKYISKNINNSDNEIIKLIYYLMAHGKYGIYNTLDFLQFNEHELFSEMFAYWMIVPIYSKNLSIKWNLLNQFFTEYLPKYYNNLIK